MQVKILIKKEIQELHTEEQLLDMSTTESLYQIRKLKAIVHQQMGKTIIANCKNNSNQYYLPDFNIWMDCEEVQ